MEIAIRGTEVTIIGTNIIGFEGNNLVNSITGNVDTESGWDFILKVFMVKTQQYNSIPMTRDNNIIYVTLTSDMMPVGGKYIGQFEMTKGSQIMQTDQFEFWVNNSINLNAVWTPIPTTFEQLAENVRIMQLHPPVPGNNGFWLIWDVENSEYQESIQALPAYTLPAVTEADNGKVAYVENGVWVAKLLSEIQGG